MCSVSVVCVVSLGPEKGGGRSEGPSKGVRRASAPSPRVECVPCVRVQRTPPPGGSVSDYKFFSNWYIISTTYFACIVPIGEEFIGTYQDFAFGTGEGVATETKVF